MIKAVVFDYGNVISEAQDKLCYVRMAQHSGLSEDFFMSSFWKYRADFDRGTLRGEEMYRKLLDDSGVSGTDEELSEIAKKLLQEDIKSWSRVSQTVTDWGLFLQKQGYKIGILSNMPFDFLEIYGASIELFIKADTAVFSCNERQIKPEQAIYQTLIDRIGCAPEEIVFFDDMQVNIDGARKEGINAFLWTGVAQAKSDWEGLAGKKIIYR